MKPKTPPAGDEEEVVSSDGGAEDGTEDSLSTELFRLMDESDESAVTAAWASLFKSRLVRFLRR